jgi:KTSC domain
MKIRAISDLLHLFSTEWYRVCKRSQVLQIFLAFGIATVMVAVASAEPLPTPDRVVSRIPRQSVESTAIAKIGYSKRRHILEIEFVNGAVYRYLNVPSNLYRNLISAESKARFYDSNIRRHYHSVLIRSQQKEQATK